jgi:hypothetical protein
MAEYTTFGLAVKHNLDAPPRKTLLWLCKEINKDTGLKVDSARMSRILTGADKSPRIIASICKILEIPVPTLCDK